jgi:predicted AlkP superfamily pyrophosphatase or phosphodiesterase
MTTMLPAIPGTFGRLTDVFASSLGAISGTDNRLNFRHAKRVICVLVDGLGSQNLKAAAGHAPFLNQALARTKPISCGFPTTTATSITSFGTGVSAGIHGLVGYKLFDRTDAVAFNLLNGWDSVRTPETWQTQQTVSERAVATGIGSYFIGPKAYAGSEFTRATMRGATYIGGRSIGERFEEAGQLLRTERGDSLTYLYVPELDQTAHSLGVASDKWLQDLEDLDAAVRGLSAQLGKNDALLVTADHGVLDVAPNQHIYLDEFAFDWTRVANVSGDPRVNFVYLQDQSAGEAVAAELQPALGDRALALTKQQVVGAGWYPNITDAVAARLPEVFVLATKNVAIYHRDHAPAASLNMIGQHGALSSVELQVPLLGWGVFGA